MNTKSTANSDISFDNFKCRVTLCGKNVGQVFHIATAIAAAASCSRQKLVGNDSGSFELTRIYETQWKIWMSELDCRKPVHIILWSLHSLLDWEVFRVSRLTRIAIEQSVLVVYVKYDFEPFRTYLTSLLKEYSIMIFSTICQYSSIIIKL